MRVTGPLSPPASPSFRTSTTKRLAQPRFGIAVETTVFLIGAGLGGGGLIAALVGAIRGEMKKEFAPVQEKVNALLDSMEGGNYRVLGVPVSKAFRNRQEKQVQLEIGGHRYTYTRIAARENNKVFLSGSEMTHSVLQNNDGFLLEYTVYRNPVSGKKQNGKNKSSFRFNFNNSATSKKYFTRSERGIPKNTSPLFEAIEDAIAESQTLAGKGGNSITLFSTEPQLFKK